MLQKIQHNRGRDEFRNKILKWAQRDEDLSEGTHSDKKEG